ncbi:hypothetical protein EMCRGX_G028589 [Ephydatia muelleri]
MAENTREHGGGRRGRSQRFQVLSAAERGDLQALKDCRRPAIINSRTLIRNDTALHLGARHGHLNIVTEIFRKSGDGGTACMTFKNRWGDTPLHEAVRQGHLAIVVFLLGKGVDINAVNKKGHTALHEAVKKGYKEIVSSLYEKNVDINAVTYKSKCTALHKAAKKGDAEIVAVLLGRVTNDPSRKWPNVPGPVEGEDSTRFLFAADVNIVDKDGRTPLHYACKEKGNALECVKMLLETENVHLDLQDKDGLTALHVAASYGSKPICECLLTKRRQQDVNSQCKIGRTALHYAVRCERQERVTANRLCTFQSQLSHCGCVGGKRGALMPQDNSVHGSD